MAKTTARKPRASTPARHGLSYQLREIVEARGLTAYAAGKLAGVDPGVVQRFLTGERDIRLGTADRLAAVLGLRLVELARGKGRARPARANVGPAEAGDGAEASASVAGPEASGEGGCDG